MNKIVYTVITGNYDKLKDPKVITDGWDYIAFVDDASKHQSKIWQIREFKKNVNYSDVLNNRRKKINIPFKGKELLTIYVDGSIEILGNLNAFVRKSKHRRGISALGHHARNCIYDEAQQVKKLMKADHKQVDLWVNEIYQNGYERHLGLNQCGLMIRNNTEEVRSLMRDWWQVVRDKVSRDQLSFNYIMWKNGYVVNTIELSLFRKYFKIHHHEIKLNGSNVNGIEPKVSFMENVFRGKSQALRARNITIRR